MKKTVTGMLIMVLLATMFLPTMALAQENTLETAARVGLQYRTHIQDYGWETSWITDGNLSGTVGESKRLEALQISLTGTLPAGATIESSMHIQNKGDLGPFAMGKLAGTHGLGLRMESIKLELKNLPGYTLKYNVHVQNQGWLKNQLDDSTWFESGQVAGTSGRGLRLESIRIKLIKLNTEYSAYQKALAAVVESDYTSDSWATYQAVVKANVVVETDADTKIKKATTNIITAQKKLIKGKNMSDYKAALAATVKAEYTEESWENYQKVLDANVVSQLNTQAEIDKATEKILEAQKDLKRKVDFTDYKEALASVREPDYTPETWAIYQAIIANIVITEDSTQTEVNAATQKIIEAQNKMVRKYDFSAYNGLLEAVNEKDYTSISWAVYQSILSENVVDNNNTQSEIEAAIKRIEAAQKELVKASNLLTYNAVLSVAVKADYTTASWLIYQKVVQENAVTDNFTQAEVDAATAKILEAQKKLVRAGIMMEYDELLLRVKQEDYTTKSWDAYTKVISGNSVSPASGQLAIDAVILKIQEAQKMLVLRGDLTKYNAAREACKESAYTTKTWTIYKKVLDTNARTYDDTQIVIDESTTKIVEAQKALLKKGDLTAYQALINAKALEQDKYTIKSWIAYQKSLKSKKITGDNSQSEIDAAIEAIVDLHKELVIKGDLLAYDAAIAAGEAMKVGVTNASWKTYQSVVNANRRTTEDAQDLIQKSTATIIDAQLKLVPIAGEYQDYVNLVERNLEKKDDYRKIPWDTYDKVVKANKRTSEDDSAKIIAAITAIENAWETLNEDGLVAKEALAAYELLKNSVKEVDYTKESWAEYKKVLAIPANKVTKENSKTEIEVATAAIKAGQAMLIPIGRFDAFMEAIELYSYDLQHKNAKGNGEITQRYVDYGKEDYYKSWDFYGAVVRGYADFDTRGKGAPNAEYKGADEATINNATQNILTAKNKVKTIIDMSEYYTVVAKVPLKEKSDQDLAAATYTKASLSDYEMVYRNIENTLMAEPIKIKEPSVVTDAAKRLAAAQQFLVKKPQIGIGTKFGDAVQHYLVEKEQSRIYTAATWKPYESAYTEYINSYSVEKNTQTQYDLAAEKLEELRGKLEYTPEAVGEYVITKAKLEEGGIIVGTDLLARAKGLVKDGYEVTLATTPSPMGVDSAGEVQAGAVDITISFEVRQTAKPTNVVVMTVTGLKEEKAAAAEVALLAYEAKSAANVNFLEGTNAANSATAKIAAGEAINAYKGTGTFSYFDARKTAADSLDTAGQAIKTAYDAAVAKKSEFMTGITAASELKTALEALSSAATTNPTATATATAAKNYVAATKEDVKGRLNNAFDITVTTAGGADGQLTVAMPWLATPAVNDLEITLPTTGDYKGKIEVVGPGTALKIQVKENYVKSSAGTASIKFKPKDQLATYFGVDKTVTIAVAMPIGTATPVAPIVAAPLTVSK